MGINHGNDCPRAGLLGAGRPDLIGDFVRGMNSKGMISLNTANFLAGRPVAPLDPGSAGNCAANDLRVFKLDGSPVVYCIRHREPYFNRGCVSCEIEQQDSVEC